MQFVFYPVPLRSGISGNLTWKTTARKNSSYVSKNKHFFLEKRYSLLTRDFSSRRQRRNLFGLR